MRPSFPVRVGAPFIIMTIVQRVRIAQSAWTEWPDPPRATLRAIATVAGPAEELTDDICCELANRLDWGEYGVTILPESTLPLDTPDGGEARLEIGSLVVVTDPNQGAPEFEHGSPEPAVSDVRIRLEQPISQDLADRPELLRRRQQVRAVLSRIYGRIDCAELVSRLPEPVQIAGEFSAEFSREFDAVVG